MRLVDADAMHKFVEEKVAEGKDGWADGVPYEWAYALTAVDMQPTAYDPDRVVEALEAESYLADIDGIGRCYGVEIDTAIEIVKKGGVE